MSLANSDGIETKYIDHAQTIRRSNRSNAGRVPSAIARSNFYHFERKERVTKEYK